MSRKQSQHEMARVWSALVMMAIWLEGAAGGLAAEPAVPPGKPADFTAVAGDTAVLLDEDTVWRHLHLEGPSFFLLDDPKVTSLSGVPYSQVRRTPCVKTAAGTMAKVGLNYAFVNNSTGISTPVDWPAEATSLPPPSDWAGVTFDDSAWMRAYWPQPLADPPYTGFAEKAIPAKAANPFDTVVVLARSRFEIKDPTRVKACRLSLDYWGGVVVYVNGKEAARGHLPGQEPNILERLAEAYPTNALPSGRRGDKLTPAGCTRQLRDIEIPAALLRPGVNVLAVEAHATAIPYSVWKRYDTAYAWPPIGVLKARLTVSPADAAVTNSLRLRGLQVWNCAVSDTVTAGDDLSEVGAPVRPVVIRAARNSVFSGRLMVGSDQTIKGLTGKLNLLQNQV